jgi:hypothetical protein
VQYGDPPTDENTSRNASGSKPHYLSLSRSVCSDNAKKIAEVFQKYAEKYDLAQVYGTGLQHAGTSATALMGEILLQTDWVEQRELMSHLSSLRVTISLMAKSYQPAKLMTTVVDQFIRSIDINEDGTSRQTITTEEMELPESVGVEQLDVLANAASAGRAMDTDAASMPRKRQRFESSYMYTPIGSGAQSPQGLPFLPSSFLDGLSTADTAFPDLGGFGDLGFSWDHHMNNMNSL